MVLVLAAYGTPDQSAAGAEQTGFNSSSIGGSMMVRGLGTVIYHVADLHRATTWYTQAFQQEPYFDEPFYVGFKIGGYELGLDPDFTLSKPGPGGGVAYWRVEQIEAAVQHFASVGAIVAAVGTVIDPERPHLSSGGGGAARRLCRCRGA